MSIESFCNEPVMDEVYDLLQIELRILYKIAWYCVDHNVGYVDKAKKIISVLEQYCADNGYEFKRGEYPKFEWHKFDNPYVKDPDIAKMLNAFSKPSLKDMTKEENQKFYALPERERERLLREEQELEYLVAVCADKIQDYNEALINEFSKITSNFNVIIELRYKIQNFDMTPIEEYNKARERFARFGDVDKDPRVLRLKPSADNAMQQYTEMKDTYRDMVWMVNYRPIRVYQMKSAWLKYFYNRLLTFNGLPPSDLPSLPLFVYEEKLKSPIEDSM